MIYNFGSCSICGRELIDYSHTKFLSCTSGSYVKKNDCFWINYDSDNEIIEAVYIIDNFYQVILGFNGTYINIDCFSRDPKSIMFKHIYFDYDKFNSSAKIKKLLKLKAID